MEAMNSTVALDLHSAVRFEPLSPALGIEVYGIDLSQPMDEAAFRSVEQAWYDGLILLFRGQRLEELHQVRFAERFGPLAGVLNKHEGRGRHPAIMYISNIMENGKLIGALPDGEMYFHSDQCYVEQPAMATMLYSMEMPSRGGDTLFANMYKAYDTLPDDLKGRLAGKRAMNAYDYGNSATRRGGGSASEAPRYAHPVIRTHPATGRKALYVNRLMTEYIEDLPRPESDELLAMLFEHAEQPAFVYRHVWQPGELILWDNRCTLHARSDFAATERRKLRRVTVLGEKPF
jgi:taurine dioxygenase